MRYFVSLLVAGLLGQVKGLGAQQELHVTQVLPEGALRPSSTITIGFSRPVSGAIEELVDPATIVRISPALPARYEWRDPATIRLIPRDPLRPGASFTLTIDTTFVAPDGGRLRAPFRVTLTVAAPQLVASFPELRAPARPELEPVPRLLLRFSGDVDSATMGRSARLEPSRGGYCASRDTVHLAARVRTQSATDPWQLVRGAANRDSIERRFDRIVELRPTEPLPLGCDLDVVLPLLEPGSSAETRYPVRSAPPLFAAVVCGTPYDCAGSTRLTVRFSAPVSLAQFRAHVRADPAQFLDPPEDTTARVQWNLPLRMLPRRSLIVTIDSTLTDIHGRPYRGDRRFALRSGDRVPALVTPSGLQTIPRRETPALRVRHLNYASIDVTISRVPDGDRLEAVQNPNGWLQSHRRRESVTYREALPYEPNVERASSVPLRLPDPSWQSSILVITVEPQVGRGPDGTELQLAPEAHRFMAGRAGWNRVATVLQSTNLMAHVRSGIGGGAAFVTDVATGRAVADAKVRALTRSPARSVEGNTASDGTARFAALSGRSRTRERGGDGIDETPPYDALWPYSSPEFVEVAKGDDRSITPLNTVSIRAGYYRAAYFPRNDGAAYARAAIYTDRDIYRPGEMIYSTAIVREGWLENPRAPAAPERVRWRVYLRNVIDGKVTVVREIVTSLSARGTASDSFRLSPRATLGTYVVRLERQQFGRWATATESMVRVAEYRAPEFTVSTAIPAQQVTLGDTVRASVTARYLFDAPMSRSAVSWRAQFSSPPGAVWRVPGVTGWTIGEQRPRFWYEGREARGSVSISGNATLGTDGIVQLAIPTDTAHFAPGAQLKLDVSVTDLNAQVVTSSAEFMIPGAQFFVAARDSGENAPWKGGESRRVLVGAVSPQGRWIDGVVVRARLLREHWTLVFDENVRDLAWRMVQDTLSVDSVMTRDTTASVTVAPRGGGLHTLQLTAVDPRGRETRTSISSWVFSAEPWVWGEDPTRLPILVQKDSLKVGDMATVTFASPFERAEAWITVEREGILWQGRRSIGPGQASVRIPVSASWIPSAEIGVVLVRQADLARTDSLAQRYRVGAAAVTIDATPRRLTVSLTPVQKNLRPRDEADIQIRVRDAEGRPVASDVILWASDEGVLSLTGFKTPNPGREFFPPTRSSVSFSTTLGSLVLHLPAERRFGFGGMQLDQVVVSGGTASLRVRGMAPVDDPFASVRTDFLTTAFYRAGVTTDAGGVARVRVSLPDNLTTFRLMAIAVAADERLGNGEAPMVVTKPMVVRAALPRFVRPADEFMAGAVVNARDGATGGTARVAAEGRGITLVGDSSATLALTAEGGLARFRWRAGTGEQAIVRLGAVAGALQDAVQVTLPVRPDQHPRAETAVRLVRDSSTVHIALPRDIDPARSRLTIRVGTTPLPVLQEYAAALHVYPHLCTEQLVSMARTIIALLQLNRAGQARTVDLPALKADLQRIVDLVVRRQGPDGSFGYWSASSWTDSWLSAYAGTMLLDAREMGADVDSEVLTRIGTYVTEAYRRTPEVPDTTYGTSVERRRIMAAHLSQRLAAIEFMTRVGNTGYENALVPHVRYLTWEDRARLALLLSRTPRLAGEGRTILRSLWSGVSLAGNRIDMPDSTLVTVGFPSRIRPAARLLLSTLALEPDHPLIGPLAQRIIQRQDAQGNWMWNTQDYAAAATAVAAFTQTLSARDAGYVVESARSGESLLRGESGGLRTEATLALTGLTVASGDSADLPVTVRVPRGAVYVTLTVDVVTAQRPMDPARHGLTVERWYERFDNGQPVTEVQTGDLVRVRLRVTAPSDREFVALEDPLPAGLEVVDVSLRTSSLGPFLDAAAESTDRQRSAQARGSWTSPAWWWGGWWRVWEEREMHDDRASFYSRMLTSGSHTVSYVARATTPGRFVKPQAHAEEMYNPALRGQSDGGWFVVRER